MRFTHTILKANLNKKGKTKIVLRVYSGRIKYYPVIYRNQNIYVTPREFKSIGKDPKFSDVAKFLSEEHDRIKAILARIDFTWSEFEKLYNGGDGLHDCFDAKIQELELEGKYSTAIGYRWAKKLFPDVKLSKVNKAYIEPYKNYGCYLKYLRHVCNRNGHSIDIKVGSTPKLKIPLTADEIRLVIEFSSDLLELQRARDFFVLSYFGGGMNTKDWYFLKRDEVVNDVIFKMRSKTSTPVIVTINDEIRTIIRRYDKGGEYVFPFRMTFKGYRTWFGNYRRALRKLQKRLGIKTKITPYVARYTHASILRSRGVSLADTQESMSHKDMSSTRVYYGYMGIDKRRELQELLRV